MSGITPSQTVGPIIKCGLTPGGGYRWVVIDKEGYEIARWLSARGFTDVQQLATTWVGVPPRFLAR